MILIHRDKNRNQNNHIPFWPSWTELAWKSPNCSRDFRILSNSSFDIIISPSVSYCWKKSRILIFILSAQNIEHTSNLFFSETTFHHFSIKRFPIDFLVAFQIKISYRISDGFTFSRYDQTYPRYGEYYEMHQKACERWFCHVIAFAIFLKCPKIKEFHFRFFFYFEIDHVFFLNAQLSYVLFLNAPFFISDSENGKNGAFLKNEHKKVGHFEKKARDQF